MHKPSIVAFAVSVAAHALLVATLTRPSSQGPQSQQHATARPRPRNVTIVVVPPEDSQFAGLNPVQDRAEGPWFDRAYSPLPLGHLAIDVTKIARRAKVLFPFLTPGLSLELFELRRPDDPDRPLESPLARATDRRRPLTPPLSMTPAALQAFVDRSWARRDRWPASRSLWALVDRHDPDEGDLPRLLRAFGEQDMGQYYADARVDIRDPRLWTELGLAADHVDFIGVIRRYASTHPSTKATTELLFILDKVAEGSRNILDTLLTTDASTKLAATRETAPDAYQLVQELQRYYNGVLEEKGLKTADAISAAYDQTRLEILNGILRTTPQNYRAADARLLVGMIYWWQRRPQEAIGSWCQMQIDPDVEYGKTESEILSVIGGRSACSGLNATAVSQAVIDRILERDERDSWTFQYERLRQFGYQPTTFWREDVPR